jgi:hypothetical protein
LSIQIFSKIVIVAVGNLHLTKLSKSGKRHVKLVSLGSLRREKTSNPERQKLRGLHLSRVLGPNTLGLRSRISQDWHKFLVLDCNAQHGGELPELFFCCSVLLKKVLHFLLIGEFQQVGVPYQNLLNDWAKILYLFCKHYFLLLGLN